MTSAPSSTRPEIWELNSAFKAAVVNVMSERQELWEIPAMLRQRDHVLHLAKYGHYTAAIAELERMAINTDTLRIVAILLYGPIRLPRRLHHPLPEEVKEGHL